MAISRMRRYAKVIAFLAICTVGISGCGRERGAAELPFFGTWYIEKVAVISEMYTGTTKDGVAEEDLYDSEDFVGYELEYTGEYYREGEPTSRYPNNPVLQERTTEDPHYAIKYITLSEFNHWGILQPYLELLIEEEGIKINNMEDYDEEETLLLQVRHRLWGHEELEKKCTLLNDDMMLIEDRGRIFFARRKGWMP